MCTDFELISNGETDRWVPSVRAEVALFAEIDWVPHISELKKT
jgi:hypothetical protein